MGIDSRKRNYLVIGCLLFLIGIFPFRLEAQVKFEKESRIGAADVPENAIRMLEQLEPGTRVRWFREESERGISFEAKYRHNKSWFSIEFDSTGGFQDVEIEISEKDIPEKTFLRMRESLEMEFDKCALRKIQRQLSGPTEEVLKHLDFPGAGQGVVTRYELIVKGRADRETHLYEILFSHSGEIERNARIIQRNTDHLVY